MQFQNLVWEKLSLLFIISRCQVGVSSMVTKAGSEALQSSTTTVEFSLPGSPLDKRNHTAPILGTTSAVHNTMQNDASKILGASKCSLLNIVYAMKCTCGCSVFVSVHMCLCVCVCACLLGGQNGSFLMLNQK